MPSAHVTLWTAPPAAARLAPGWLSSAEGARAVAYRRPVDRDRFVVGASLVRIAVARHTGAEPGDVVIDRTCGDCSRPHGRPTAPGTGVALSVTHAGRLVVVAASVDSAGVGVDIEEVPVAIESQPLDLALSPAERAWVRASGEVASGGVASGEVAWGEASGPSPEASGPSPEERFTRLWTLKEAAVKATGDGLRAALAGVGVKASDRDVWRLAAYPGQLPSEPMALVAIPARLLGAGLLGAVAALGADSLILHHSDGFAELSRRTAEPAHG